VCRWIVMECRFYRIAQADIAGALTIELLEFFEQLKEQNRITDFCSRVCLQGKPRKAVYGYRTGQGERATRLGTTVSTTCVRKGPGWRNGRRPGPSRL